MDVQVNLVLALTGLFNFINDTEREFDSDFTSLEQFDSDSTDTGIAIPTFNERTSTARKQIIKFRDQLASAMWTDYQYYITARY
jgi:hypothetical protein